MFTRHREAGNILFCTRITRVHTPEQLSAPSSLRMRGILHPRWQHSEWGHTEPSSVQIRPGTPKCGLPTVSCCALRRHDVAQPKSRAAKARESWCPCCGRKRMHRERSAALDQGQARGCRESAGGWCLPGYYEAQSTPSGRGDADHAEGEVRRGRAEMPEATSTAMAVASKSCASCSTT